MRLATLSTPTGPRPAFFVNGGYLPIETLTGQPVGTMRELLDVGLPTLRQFADRLLDRAHTLLPPESVTLMAPILDPEKVICVGLNYKDHAAESGAAIPREPVLFSKFPSALIGHNEAIVLPPVSEEVDYEAELVLVVGKKGRWIPEAEALTYLAGYTVGHDVSARDWQLKKDGRQWMAGKTFDTFAPTGPHIVTTDEVPDAMKLGIRLRLNGTTLQDSNTAQMIFSPAAIIAYVSQIVTLQPGDLIFTGTPPGVGVAKKPPLFLKAGDMCEVEIDSLGVLRNPVVQGERRA
jgi:2-keto-4-pentenoate hydratase/2-oxohepta-3-ene-1,7-dioic acid hydratase in catechol pathway